MSGIREAYLKLQNGSDVRGVALEGVEGEQVNLLAETAQNIAAAFVDYLSDKKGKAASELKIGIGHDSRLSAEALKQGVINGLGSRGSRAFDCGLTSTPSMFMSTVLDGFYYDGAVMITASHLPFNRNGLKFFTEEGGLESKDIKAVLERAAEIAEEKAECESEAGKAECEKAVYTAEQADLVGAYTEHLRKRICEGVDASDYAHPLTGLHIVIDASNGVSGYFKNVLEPLGASTEGSICMEPDGTFPVHVPNPENEQAMDTIKKAVLDSQADLGVIFDTDGDRAAVVFADGEEVNRNTIIALLAAILAEKHPHTTIVTDSVTSTHLTEFLEKKLELKHHRFKRGYKNVINESIRLNKEGIDSQLAIETSGHGAMKENYFLDDGAYMSVKIISYLAKCRCDGRRMEDMLADLGKPAESKEYRLTIQTPEFKEYGNKVLEDFRAFVAEDERFHIVEPNYEGIRINFADEEVTGWMLMRLSLHDPVIPMNFEAEAEGGVKVILGRIKPFVEQYEKLSGFPQ